MTTAAAALGCRRPLLAAGMALVLGSAGPAASPGLAASVADAPGPVEAPPYVLLPPDWPYPAWPTCLSAYGVCRYPHNYPAGTPCHCVSTTGVWVPGYISVNPFAGPPVGRRGPRWTDRDSAP